MSLGYIAFQLISFPSLLIFHCSMCACMCVCMCICVCMSMCAGICVCGIYVCFSMKIILKCRPMTFSRVETRTFPILDASFLWNIKGLSCETGQTFKQHSNCLPLWYLLLERKNDMKNNFNNTWLTEILERALNEGCFWRENCAFGWHGDRWVSVVWKGKLYLLYLWFHVQNTI